MICPDYFGCSGKISFDDTYRLAVASGQADGGRDFSEMEADGAIISSIDRVHRCARDWNRFAKIALNHAFGDVLCAGARPVQAMLSFEFGIDTLNGEWADCSLAFASELSRRGVALGKCHSGRVDGITAVTIATLAIHPTQRLPTLNRGLIYISRPIGALKLHYLAELACEDDTVTVLEQPNDAAFQQIHWDLLTDISGHGMLGAVMHVARRHGLDIDLFLSAELALSPDVLSIPVECLQNPSDSYGLSLGGIDARAELLVTLRETAGPFLGFIEDGATAEPIAGSQGVLVGRYRGGNEKVEILWNE